MGEALNGRLRKKSEKQRILTRMRKRASPQTFRVRAGSQSCQDIHRAPGLSRLCLTPRNGISVLFDAFLASVFLTYLPSKRLEGPSIIVSREEGELEAVKSPTFVHTFEKYILGPQEYLMDPLFFSSIGFTIPFVQLWTGKQI